MRPADRFVFFCASFLHIPAGVLTYILPLPVSLPALVTPERHASLLPQAWSISTHACSLTPPCCVGLLGLYGGRVADAVPSATASGHDHHHPPQPRRRPHVPCPAAEHAFWIRHQWPGLQLTPTHHAFHVSPLWLPATPEIASRRTTPKMPSSPLPPSSAPQSNLVRR